MSKEAMKLALEALEAETNPTWECNSYHPKIHTAITALREALAEQPAQQEPVYFCDYGYEGWGKVDAAMAAENRACGMTVEAYYTSPQAQRKPLTDDEFSKLCLRVAPRLHRLADAVELLKAIEAAHGIGEKK